jgi:hypothetical protein
MMNLILRIGISSQILHKSAEGARNLAILKNGALMTQL